MVKVDTGIQEKQIMPIPWGICAILKCHSDMDAFKEAFDYSSHPWSIVEDAPFFPVNVHTSVRLFFDQTVKQIK